MKVTLELIKDGQVFATLVDAPDTLTHMVKTSGWPEFLIHDSIAYSLVEYDDESAVYRITEYFDFNA